MLRLKNEQYDSVINLTKVRLLKLLLNYCVSCLV